MLTEIGKYFNTYVMNLKMGIAAEFTEIGKSSKKWVKIGDLRGKHAPEKERIMEQSASKGRRWKGWEKC